ncbi:MAG TPA: ABC transporter ATP-binding protein [Xanthobacteraceae bacterium]|jgi:branched-chain amino acid transport system ATP-binding protein
MTAALEIDAVAIRFGGVQAVAGVSCTIEPGELVGLVGPNGAGKTTLLKIIAGVLAADSGRIMLSGTDVTRLATELRVRKGLAITHQIVRPFRSMSALENVTLAAGHRLTARPLVALVRLRREAEEARARAILARVGLSGLERKAVGALALGQLKRLELARALAIEPSLLLLDEPLAGLNQSEASQQADVISTINDAGITTVLIEHNLTEVLRVSRRVIVLDQGRIIADGNPRAVMSDARVREAYLGQGQAHAAA